MSLICSVYCSLLRQIEIGELLMTALPMAKEVPDGRLKLRGVVAVR